MTLNVITRGFGPGASIPLVICRGYGIGAAPVVSFVSDDLTGPLQAAILALLRAASPVIAGGRIHDALPVEYDASDGKFPYVMIGEIQDVTDDTSASGGTSDDGIVSYVTLHVWSRYRGKAEVLALNTRLYRALHGIELTVAGRSSALSWIDSMIAMDDPDGISRHGIVTCRVIHRTN